MKPGGGGVVVPDAVSKPRYIEDAWFEDFGHGTVLVGGQCPTCGRIYFPVKRVCPECFGDGQRKVPLSRRGKLHTFAVSYLGPAGIPTPYVIGFVDLPEGIRLFSLITQCEPWEQVLRVDMDVEMVLDTIGRDEAGGEIVGYKFRPLREAGA